jgi:hypothetical protein
MVQNVYRLVQAMNANVKMKAFLENIVNIVNYIPLFHLSISTFLIKFKSKDYSCWNDPCEGCIPLNNKSFEFECTCSLKSFDSTCKSG